MSGASPINEPEQIDTAEVGGAHRHRDDHATHHLPTSTDARHPESRGPSMHLQQGAHEVDHAREALRAAHRSEAATHRRAPIRRRKERAPPDSVHTAHGSCAERSDQSAQRQRRARSAPTPQRHRNDTATTKGRSPDTERTDRTGQRAPRDGRAPARTTAGARRPRRESERPLDKALGPARR